MGDVSKYLTGEAQDGPIASDLAVNSEKGTFLFLVPREDIEQILAVEGCIGIKLSQEISDPCLFSDLLEAGKISKKIELRPVINPSK